VAAGSEAVVAESEAVGSQTGAAGEVVAAGSEAVVAGAESVAAGSEVAVVELYSGRRCVEDERLFASGQTWKLGATWCRW